MAEELHFARAAERLHIEQSPLSRAIKELEGELGVVLFARTTRSTRLTRAGKLFLDHVLRVFAALQQARDSVKAAVNGFHSNLVPWKPVIEQRLGQPLAVTEGNGKVAWAIGRQRDQGI